MNGQKVGFAAQVTGYWAKKKPGPGPGFFGSWLALDRCDCDIGGNLL
jgi:hypothetical protein